MYQGKTIERYEIDYEVKIDTCKSLIIKQLSHSVRTQEREQKIKKSLRTLRMKAFLFGSFPK